MNLKKEAMDWLDRRLGVRELLHGNLQGYLLPRNINIWYTLGAVLMAMFGLQFLTGVVLLVYYVPDTGKSFRQRDQDHERGSLRLADPLSARRRFEPDHGFSVAPPSLGAVHGQL